MSDELKREQETGMKAETGQEQAKKENVAPQAAPEQAPSATPEQTPQAAQSASAEKEQAPQAAPEQASNAAPTAQAEAATPRRKETDEEKAARRKAAFEARQAAKAAAAQAKAAEAAGNAPAATGGDEAEAPPPKPPSPNQPRLDLALQLIREQIGEDAVEEAYINEINDDLPTLVIKPERWAEAAKLFKEHEALACNYLRNISGVDYETHMEVVYYPLNMERRENYCIKVRTNREQPSVPSVTSVWATANWNEREIYDLLGIDFPGHPNLTRIMMPDDWVGHPLRKDYVPLDPEV